MAGSYEMMWIADHKKFTPRLIYFAMKAAIAIMTESAATANHAERVTYAKKILDGTADLAAYGHAVVTDSPLSTNGDMSATDFGITDANLETAVNSMLNAMAGIATT